MIRYAGQKQGDDIAAASKIRQTAPKQPIWTEKQTQAPSVHPESQIEFFIHILYFCIYLFTLNSHDEMLTQ